MKIALWEVEWHAHGTGAGTLAPPRDPTFDSSYGGLIPLRVEGQARVMRRRGPTGRPAARTQDPLSQVRRRHDRVRSQHDELRQLPVAASPRPPGWPLFKEILNRGLLVRELGDGAPHRPLESLEQRPPSPRLEPTAEPTNRRNPALQPTTFR